MANPDATTTRQRHFIAAAPRIARAFHACRDYGSEPENPGPTFWGLSTACDAVAGAIVATRPAEASLWDAAGVAVEALAGRLASHERTHAKAGAR